MNRKSIETGHGGMLVDLVVDSQKATLLKDVALNLHDVILNEHQLCYFELLATGAFSPLSGFMNRTDYEAVLDRMQLQDGTLWPMPICLDVNRTLAESLEVGQSIAIRDPEGFLLAVMHVEDIWPIDKEKEAELLFGSYELKHPGVQRLINETGEYYLGGQLEVLNLPVHYDFLQLRMTPKDTRHMFKKLGWRRVVGFQTRKIMHRPQFELTLQAMRRAEANLLLLPVVGVTRPSEFEYYTRVRCQKKLLKYYPPNTCLLNLLPLTMRLAGAREAMLQAIIAKNYGCSHFIVGYNHAIASPENDELSLFKCEEIHRQVIPAGQDIGIEIITFDKMVYLPFEDEYRPSDKVEEGIRTISLDDDEIKRRIKAGRRIPEWATFPEVVCELQKAYPPPGKQGFTVFLTGLSGAGKSTVAKILYSRMMEIGERPVTLLDGDIVRRNLSSELNFSKEHRDINVRRIGFVAREITKNKGIAICAPIAPYSNTRREIRRSIEEYGGFIEIHVCTPMQVCEKRDRKGMYAKARAGLIKGFTGVDDPYEIPDTPELRIDTTDKTPEESAQEVLLFLGQKGYI